MKKTIITALLLAVSYLAAFAYEIPKGWHKAGSMPEKYDMGIDKGAGRDGKDVATIKSNTKRIKGFGTLMQTSLPGIYAGKRVRMTGWMKSTDVNTWAGFWFRVDEAGTTKPLAFDNMYNRAVKGTTEWKKYEIVLDVPMKADKIAYGALIGGEGQIWFDDINFEVVSETTQSTSLRSTLPQPQNLSFEN